MYSAISYRVVADFDGSDILLFKLQNKTGSYAEVCNYGATLISLVVPDATGEMNNIILNYPDIEDYFTDTSYIGSTIGRFANRIANARFELDGKTYLLDTNDGENSNHGGYKGFNSQVFSSEIKADSLVLSYISQDGEGGFPGTLRFSVDYSFSDENQLKIEYKACADKKTVFNPTCHAYFNLSGKNELVLSHELKVFADYYLESKDDFIPTGVIKPVKDSAFDFKEFREIQSLMPLKNEVLPGYNTYFIGNSEATMKHLASLHERKSGITVDVFSTMPGLQIYTGDYLSNPHRPLSGICLEAQFYPDGPNHPHFDTCILNAGEIRTHIIHLLIH